MPIKYQEIWDRYTKYRFDIGIFLVYQIFGYRLTALVGTHTHTQFKRAELEMAIKYQEIWDRYTKYRFDIGIFLVYQIFGYRLTALIGTHTLRLFWNNF